MLGGPVCRYQRFGATYCLHLQLKMRVHTALQPRRQASTKLAYRRTASKLLLIGIHYVCLEDIKGSSNLFKYAKRGDFNNLKYTTCTDDSSLQHKS
jgi:hypothetical protein